MKKINETPTTTMRSLSFVLLFIAMFGFAGCSTHTISGPDYEAEEVEPKIQHKGDVSKPFIDFNESGEEGASMPSSTGGGSIEGGEDHNETGEDD